jgi:hypothetical protein
MDIQTLDNARERAEAAAGPCSVRLIENKNYIVGPHGRIILEELDADMDSLIFHATARETVIALCDEIRRLNALRLAGAA